MKKTKLRTEWKPGTPPLTEEEMNAHSCALDEKYREHIKGHGPRFSYDVFTDTTGRVYPGTAEEITKWKARNYLIGFDITPLRMNELSHWPLFEDGQMDILVGLSIRFPQDKDPSYEELKELGYENTEEPNAPQNDEEWRFIREVIRPEKKDRLNNLLRFQARRKELETQPASPARDEEMERLRNEFEQEKDKRIAAEAREKQEREGRIAEKAGKETAVKMHRTLAKQIEPSVETGFEGLADKVALRKKGPGKNKRKDVPLAGRQKENAVYAHWKKLPSRMTFEQFAEAFPEYGLSADKLKLLIRRVRKRRERGTK